MMLRKTELKFLRSLPSKLTKSLAVTIEGAFDDKIISMYAKSMSARDIQAHILELNGTGLSPAMVYNIIDKVIVVANERQGRPLKPVYPVIYFDAIQLCVIQMIRNSIKYIPHKNSKEFMLDLKVTVQIP